MKYRATPWGYAEGSARRRTGRRALGPRSGRRAEVVVATTVSEAGGIGGARISPPLATATSCRSRPLGWSRQ